MKNSDWRYYLPDCVETADDAQTILLYDWQIGISNARQAAELAAEDEWDNRDGWEEGPGDGPDIVVISPDGIETRFSTYREASIDHLVREIPAEETTT